ncbi:general APC amino acid permease [Amanita muscaria]
MDEEYKKEAITDKAVEEGTDRVFLNEKARDKIAIAGTIGTGLFLGSGSALAAAGPLGALIAYALVGTVAYSTVCSVGEMTTWAPVSGTFPHFAARWVDPAFGFAVGWNYFYTNAISTPVEVTAATILLTFWDSNSKHQPIYIAHQCFWREVRACINMGLAITSDIDIQGTSAKYWKTPGAINRAGLGMELVAIAASETENPRRNIAKAVRRVFYRITIFYILGILIIGMLVAYDNPNLLLRSPYNCSQFKMPRRPLNHLSSLLSIQQASKVLNEGRDWELTFCDIQSCFSLLAFMSVSTSASTVFTWFVNLSTTGGFFGWFSINLTYIFFRRGMVAQGFDLRKNTYNNRFQPYIAYWGCFWTVIFILINGFSVFFKWNVSSFLTSYINIPFFVTLYLAWKIIKRTPVWKPHEMDLVTGIPSIEETEMPEVPPRNVWEKIAEVVF